MKEEKTRVFLTGATGVMGMAGLKELVRFPEEYEVTVLARDSKRNHEKLSKFEDRGVKVIWGDLSDEKALREGIHEADIVLHVGGMVSPEADRHPKKTLEVNIGSMQLISRIIKEIETKDPQRTIKIVYIGSVSQYGTKKVPEHWGKVGDKLKAAKFDAYAVSKIIAERVLVESGVKKWVSLRQTWILHPGLLRKANDPISFHVPIKGVLEWVTVEDSGRLLERVCRKDLPDSFWCNYYNVGGGEAFRLTNLEFERSILKGIGCPPPEKIFEPHWFATDNFHGMWFLDSDNLENILHFRNILDTPGQAVDRMKKSLPFYFKLAPLAPAFAIKKFMKGVACDPELGTLTWLKNGDEEKIAAFWGSKENHAKIESWSRLEEKRLCKSCEKQESNISGSSNLREKICERGHVFPTSEALEAGGHGCPHCLFIDSQVDCPKIS